MVSGVTSVATLRGLSPEAAVHGELTSLRIGQPQASPVQVLFEDGVPCSQILDDLERHYRRTPTVS
jgi:hypothetical protein